MKRELIPYQAPERKRELAPAKKKLGRALRRIENKIDAVGTILMNHEGRLRMLEQQPAALPAPAPAPRQLSKATFGTIVGLIVLLAFGIWWVVSVFGKNIGTPPPPPPPPDEVEVERTLARCRQAAANLDHLRACSESLASDVEVARPRIDKALGGRYAATPLAEQWRRIRGFQGCDAALWDHHRTAVSSAQLKIELNRKTPGYSLKPHYQQCSEAEAFIKHWNWTITTANEIFVHAKLVR